MKTKDIVCIVLLLLLVYLVFSKKTIEGIGPAEGGSGILDTLLSFIPGDWGEGSNCGTWETLIIDESIKDQTIRIWDNLHINCEITKGSITGIGAKPHVVDLILKLFNNGNPITQFKYIELVNRYGAFMNERENVVEGMTSMFGVDIGGLTDVEKKLIPEVITTLAYLWIGGGKVITKDEFSDNLMDAIPLKLPPFIDIIISSEIDQIFDLFDVNTNEILTLIEFQDTKHRKERIKEVVANFIDKVPDIILEGTDANKELIQADASRTIDRAYLEIDIDKDGISILEIVIISVEEHLDAMEHMDGEKPLVKESDLICKDFISICNDNNIHPEPCLNIYEYFSDITFCEEGVMKESRHSQIEVEKCEIKVEEFKAGDLVDNFKKKFGIDESGIVELVNLYNKNKLSFYRGECSVPSESDVIKFKVKGCHESCETCDTSDDMEACTSWRDGYLLRDGDGDGAGSCAPPEVWKTKRLADGNLTQCHDEEHGIWYCDQCNCQDFVNDAIKEEGNNSNIKKVKVSNSNIKKVKVSNRNSNNRNSNNRNSNNRNRNSNRNSNSNEVQPLNNNAIQRPQGVTRPTSDDLLQRYANSEPSCYSNTGPWHHRWCNGNFSSNEEECNSIDNKGLDPEGEIYQICKWSNTPKIRNTPGKCKAIEPYNDVSFCSQFNTQEECSEEGLNVYCEWDNNPDEPSGICSTIDGDFIDKIICSEYKYKEECETYIDRAEYDDEISPCSWIENDTNTR